MPEVLRRLGINVIEQNATIQGEFFARDTEHIPDMQNLMDRVKAEKADFGVGFDADGDRAVFVNENGDFVPGDYSAAIIAKNTAKYSIVTTVAASQVVESLGKKVYRTQVGSPYILEKMKKVGASIGFEPNGGCFFPHIMMTRDGGATCIEFLKILRSAGKSVSQLVSELPKFYSSKDKIDYKWELEDKILETAKSQFQGIKLEELDGLKIWVGENSWILFRSSKNAPEFRVFAESADKLESERLLKEGVSLVKRIVEESA